MASYYRDDAAPTPNNPRRVGALALIARADSLLLEHRSDFGVWGLIGGAVDEDETVTEAVIREVREETGLEAISTSLFGVFTDPTRIVAYPDGNVFRLCTVVFRVETASGEPVPSDESLDVRFVPKDELDSLEITAAHTPIVDAWRARPEGVVVA